jgi:hypothetical protein
MDATPNELLDQRIAKRKRQNTARVQRYRQRRQNGGCVFTVDLSGDDINRLIKVGQLSANQRDDPSAVKAAVLRMAGLDVQAKDGEPPPLSQEPAKQHTLLPPTWFPDRCNQCRRFAGRLEAFPVNGQKVLFHGECWQSWCDAHRDVVAQSGAVGPRAESASAVVAEIHCADGRARPGCCPRS